jgi:hypothetical protein
MDNDKNYELVRRFVSVFFNNEFYVDGIENARDSIATNARSQANWLKISSIIQIGNLNLGSP